MITIKIWYHFVLKHIFYTDMINIFLALLLSFIAIPLDIIFSPLELVAYIIHKQLYKDEED